MLYNKHLQDLESLQKERAALKKKAKKKAESFAKSAKKRQEEGRSTLDKGIGFLTSSLSGGKLGTATEVAAKFAVPYLLRRGARTGVRKIVTGAAKEVAFGYIKWKAISLAVRLISNQIKKKKKEAR